jgi:uncharacterized OsmC-like protein
MAVVKQKEPIGRQVRVADSKCPEGVRCEISVQGGHTIITDEPAERGGTDTAASPLMYFTSSLAACQTVQIVKVAEAMRFKHGAININAETVTDRIEGVAGGNARVMRFCAAKMIIDIETDETPERFERLQRISEDQCPVGNLFTDAGYEPEVIWNALPMK